MNDTEDAPRHRNIAQLVVIALIIALIVVTQIFSHRPRMMTSRPWIEPVADIPARANLNELRHYVAFSQVYLPKRRYSPPFGLTVDVPPPAPDSPPRLGYSIREVSLLGMPLAGYREEGFVVYVDRPDAFEMAPLGDDGLKLLEQKAGAALSQGFSFPYWRYYWGWSLFVLLAAWGVLEIRRRARYRAESGIM
jgi:hypothetical protein